MSTVSGNIVSTLTPTSMQAAYMFGGLFLFRYVRLFGGIYAYNTYKPKPVLAEPSFTSNDVSVIIPTTFKKPDELAHCIFRIRLCNPAKIFVVTADVQVQGVQEMIAKEHFDAMGSDIVVLGVAELNKRNQILRAMKHVDTTITVLADDDVFWPDNYLPYLLAIFEDKKVGAGGTRQRVKRNPSPDFWNFLGISYLERRVFNNVATNAIDGGISTLSGRTAAYRTCILKCPKFEYYFTHDEWRGQKLNSDDDKCLTRYVYSNGWKIAIQFDGRSIIETTVEGNSAYLSQCMRWARAHWRGNYTVMENEKYWRSLSMLWSMYYVYVTQFLTPSLVVDAMLFIILKQACSESTISTTRAAYGFLGGWMVFSKTAKLIPHFRRHPSDMKFIPVSIAFSYFHGFMNVYAWLSMCQTHWGSQNLTQLSHQKVEATAVDVSSDSDSSDSSDSSTPAVIG